MDLLVTESENRKRIRKVENFFGPSGTPLSVPGRVLIGEGRLVKQGRKKRALKVFFLFNDILVYGSIIMNGRWYKKQKLVALADIKVEDLEDSDSVKHQWLLCTPFKSFYLSASSYEEKRGWLDHIRDCQSRLLKETDAQPGSNFAMSWIPDKAAQKCMRCLKKFTTIHRKHHCRKCGFVVCNECSKQRELIENIDSTREVRICKVCSTRDDEDNDNEDNDNSRQRGDSSGMQSCEEEEGATSGDEDQMQTSSTWLDTKDCTWMGLSPFLYSEAQD
ncbi:pleckstrin homology domain-containing family F member 2 [Kryptolebias marmoratus]|uniref:Pleckstrin homology and FYVE domain containing 1 n=1 Tax=Kryptolebias marmoratus TaxID=37003 RepID=A0A3Q3ALT9_KRYMA|nr:pleckstrin homology domain-containing family F member 2 [Kryptolebias marmoratus]